MGHLTPQLLKLELLQFRKVRDYLPPILVIHLNPFYESTIEKEVAQISSELKATISLGKEGMKFRL